MPVESQCTYVHEVCSCFWTAEEGVREDVPPHRELDTGCRTPLHGMKLHCRLLGDIARANAEGWRFGAKLVRGAYMVSHRAPANMGDATAE